MIATIRRARGFSCFQVVGLKREIPQDMWNALEIVFRRHDRRPSTRNSEFKECPSWGRGLWSGPQLGTARPPDSPQAIPAGFVKTFKPEGIRKGDVTKQKRGQKSGFPVR